jgi:epoxyqueuosine reductase
VTGPAADELRCIGLAAGLDAVGIAPADRFSSTERDLLERRADGLHGGMQFTYRNPARSTDPAATLPGARSLVVGARSYDRGEPPAPDGHAGRVARYAWSDHYAELRAGLEAIAERLRAADWAARVVADDNALVDREAAVRAGLGWYGKSSNVLLPGRGSWFVLGTVITDAPLEPSQPVGDGCGTCTRCISACPTGAIIAPGVVDARRCLAWLVQAPGSFPVEHRVALGDRIYGCDDCQDVCPPNRRAVTPPPLEDDAAPWVDLLDMLSASDHDLLDRHGRWYIAERDPRHLRRNALIALGNVGDPDDPRVRATLQRYVDGGDELLREHASWATSQLAAR